MNRLLVAILLSLAVHGALLLCRFGWPTTAARIDVPLRVITVQLPDAPSLPAEKVAATPAIPPVQPKRKPAPRAMTVSQPRTAVTATSMANVAQNINADQPTTPVVSISEQEATPPQGNAGVATQSNPGEEPQLAHPLYRENQPPGYPPLARKQRYQGTTELAVLVTKDGTADELRLQNSSGHPVLDQAAMAAVRHWKFAPGRLGAEPIAMWVTVPIRFELH